MKLDDIGRRNQAFWKKMTAEEGREANRYTRPWLDLDVALLQAFVRGEVDVLPEPYTYIYRPGSRSSISPRSSSRPTDRWPVTDDHILGFVAKHFAVVAGKPPAQRWNPTAGLQIHESVPDPALFSGLSGA